MCIRDRRSLGSRGAAGVATSGVGRLRPRGALQTAWPAAELRGGRPGGRGQMRHLLGTHAPRRERRPMA
eukprot:8999749-Lingulodinium_polyedra.AAC.1